MRRFFSPRVTIALGIAGVTVLSVSALDTAAAFTDTANAASSFSSAAKLWPPPAAAAIGCDDVTISGAHLGVRLYVIHDGSKKKYRLRFKQDDGALRNTQDIDPGTAAAGTRFNFGAVGDAQVGSHTGWNYNAEIHTVDPAGGESTDWRGYRINQPTIWNLDCKDQISSISGASSEGMFAARLLNQPPRLSHQLRLQRRAVHRRPLLQPQARRRLRPQRPVRQRPRPQRQPLRHRKRPQPPVRRRPRPQPPPHRARRPPRLRHRRW